MKKINILLISLFTYSMVCANTAFDPIVAQVKLTKTHLIKLNEIEDKISQAEKQMGRGFTDKEKDLVVESIVNNELLKQAAKRDGVIIREDMLINMLRQQVGGQATDSQIKEAVEKQYSMDWKTVSVALIEQLTLQEYIKNAGEKDFKALLKQPSQGDITAFYNSNKTKFVNSDMVRVNHIFFSTQGKSASESNKIKKKADSTMLSIKKGKKTFDDLIPLVSDDKNSIPNGGELGFITRDDPNTVALLGMDFINAVFSTSMDGVHGVISSNQGYHIYKITEKRAARILKLTDPMNPSSPVTVRQYIVQTIQQQTAAQVFAKVSERVINKLKKEAIIKVIDRNLPWK